MPETNNKKTEEVIRCFACNHLNRAPFDEVEIEVGRAIVVMGFILGWKKTIEKVPQCKNCGQALFW